MSILSDGGIRRAIKNKTLLIDPLPRKINPSSIELTLGDEVLYLKRTSIGEIDTKLPYPDDMVERYKFNKKDGFLVWPGEHYLATTIERFKLPNDVAMYVVGKSTVGRIGIVPVTAGFADPGFEGQITLEVYNVSSTPVRVYPGMFFAQAVFLCLDEPAEIPYDKVKTSLYRGQSGVTPPKTGNLYPPGWFSKPKK